MSRRHFAGLLLATACSLQAQVAVLTQHNDLARTGANLGETSLTTANVNSNQFGLVFTRAVDDQIYSQPLVMTNVAVAGGGRRNLVIVATVNDSVYAFDADDVSTGAPYWKTSFLGPKVVAPTAADMSGACGGDYKDFSGNIGIVSTPVIDGTTGTIYLVARTKEDGSRFVQRLHALDVRTGTERAGSPVEISATFPGHGGGSVNGVLNFDPMRANQRAALALVNGVVYIGWSSHCDWGPYHGWLIGYEAATLGRAAVFNTTPEGSSGGIWMSGQGPAADLQGTVYLSTGNGSVGVSGNPREPTNRGESFIRLVRSGSTMRIASWFTPYNWQDLENTDNDFGNSGVLLPPGTTLAITGSKEGKVYIVNRDTMGGLSASAEDTNIVQSFQVSSPGSSFGLFGAPVWWDGPSAAYLYLWCKQDFLRQYRFDRQAGKFILPEQARGPGATPAGMPGGMLSLSANGKRPESAILWASRALNGDANQQVLPGILRAYRAENVADELWNSEQVPARDSVGNFAKFSPPTVANGKVYLATFSNRLDVYGLLSSSH